MQPLARGPEAGVYTHRRNRFGCIKTGKCDRRLTMLCPRPGALIWTLDENVGEESARNLGARQYLSPNFSPTVQIRAPARYFSRPRFNIYQLHPFRIVRGVYSLLSVPPRRSLANMNCSTFVYDRSFVFYRINNAD